MAFPCPYCRNGINVKSPKPGVYKTKCPKCTKPFRLTVKSESEFVAEGFADDTVIEQPDKPGTVRNPPKAAPKTRDDDATHFSGPEDSEKTIAETPAAKRSAEPDATGIFHGPDAAAPADDATGVFDAPAQKTVAGSGRTRIGADDDANFEVKAPAGEPAAKDNEPNEFPESIAGYRIVKKLGRGGMGAVYLAQQVSLDRPVALKVMNPKWASDAAFVARFTREAYAAAQLAHHNIVQIYDFGHARDLHYFSMEFVEGQSLGELVKREGKLDVEQAIGYTLQAARGLRHAHDRGMVHRDVKPDNLMLSSQGIVKVADLGLVKTPGVADEPARDKVARGSKLADESLTDVTRVGMSMGTPAYMAPEQAKNASTVDGRADIYSLGCTLYVLLTGKPPYSGSTVMELLSKHASAPLVPPDAIVKRVPKEVSAIIQKMVAKRPEDRYADMGEVAKVLEEWLGLKSEGGDTRQLSEEQVAKLEESVRQYNEAPLANLRMLARVAIVGALTLAGVLFLLAGWFKMSFAALAMGVETALVSFVVAGWQSPSPLFLRVREFVLGWHWSNYLKIAGALVVFLGLLWLLNLFFIWLVATLLAGVIGAALYFALDRTVELKRQPSLESAEELFRQLRLRGMDEESLRNFVCKYGGNHWEEFYEELFGYEEKLKARDWWVRGQKGQARQKYAAWREPIIAAIDRRLLERRAEHDRRELQQLEQARLVAEGVAAPEAKAKAAVVADRMVQCAAELRQEAQQETYALAPVKAGEEPRRPRAITAVILQDTPEVEAPAPRQTSFVTVIANLANTIINPTVRMILALVLVAGFGAWMYQNGLVQQAQNIQSVDDAWALLQAKDANALSISVVPGFLTQWFAGYGAALAGLLMMMSAFLPNWKSTLLMPVAAAIAWLGPFLGVPDIGPLTGAQLSMAVGAVLGLIGIVVGRRP